MRKEDYIPRGEAEKVLMQKAVADSDRNSRVWSRAICAIKDIPAADVEPKQRWISVSDRLPENDDHVLCCTETKAGRRNVVIGYWMDGAWRCGMNSNVIAWMPLPEPPEASHA